MHFRRVWLPVAGLLFVLPFLHGCSRERFIVIGTARAPSTSGFVELKHAREHSTRARSRAERWGRSEAQGTTTQQDSRQVRVRMEQLHPANSLDPTVHAYVVWFAHGKEPPKRVGSLHYMPDERVGELEATTPHLKFVVKVTAEANDKPSTPSAFVVATQEVIADD